MFSTIYRNALKHFISKHQQMTNKRLLSTDLNLFPRQDFDYFLILDFEATCDRDKQPEPMEIIEFPVLKMNARTMGIEDIFHRYVRPTFNPTLSLFCIELTNILQETVDDADDFPTVLNEFRQWMRHERLVDQNDTPLKKFAFITYSDTDLKKLLPRQCKALHILPPFYMRHWIDIRKSYTETSSVVWPSGQTQLLAQLNLQPTGQSHSGISDAVDLSNIAVELGKSLISSSIDHLLTHLIFYLLSLLKTARRGHVFSLNGKCV